jgi:histidine decarboxylase
MTDNVNRKDSPARPSTLHQKRTEQEWALPFSLGEDGLAEAEREQTLASYRQYINSQAASFLGYPASEHAEYSQRLSWMLDHHVNNLGDPFRPGNFTVNSKAFERDVLDHFAKLWHAKTPHDPRDVESYWGYVLTMGSTEGNLYALWNARDYLKGRYLIVDEEDPTQALWVSAPRAIRLDSDGAPVAATSPQEQAKDRNWRRPAAFYSADTHYSLSKAVRVLDIETFADIGNDLYPDECPLAGLGGKWPAEVPSLNGDGGLGSIDVEALCTLVEFFAARGHPALISLNLGTTFKGAYDPVAEIEPRIVAIMKKHELYDRELPLPKDGSGRRFHSTSTRRGFWIHVDGALGAAALPYMRMAQEAGDPRMADLAPIPPFDFGIEHVFSMVMSGHKWIGAPWPCGIYMTKVKYQLEPPDMPEYIGSPDSTFAGSRNGFSSVILWDHLARHSRSDQIERVSQAQDVAAYAEQQLIRLGHQLGKDLHVARSPLALTVRFLQPADPIIHKYSLSTETYQSDANLHYAHLFVMPGVTTNVIDRFIEDLGEPGAFQEPAPPVKPAATAAAAVSDLTDIHQFSVPFPATAVPLVGRGFQ